MNWLLLILPGCASEVLCAPLADVFLVGADLPAWHAARTEFVKLAGPSSLRPSSNSAQSLQWQSGTSRVPQNRLTCGNPGTT